MTQVLIADDHSLMRQSLRALLDNATDIKVVGEAKDGREAVMAVEALEPDLVVMDISMPRLDGISATQQIRRLDVTTRVLILSMHSDQTLVREALRKGAKGYVLKRTISEELLPAIRQIDRGEVFLSRSLPESA